MRARWGTDGRAGLVAEGLLKGVRPLAGRWRSACMRNGSVAEGLLDVLRPSAGRCGFGGVGGG